MKWLRLPPVFVAPFAIAVVALASAAAAQQPENNDRAYWLIGQWSCESLGHSHGTWTFSRTDSGISLQQSFKTPDNLSGQIAEDYHFEPRAKRWVWTSTQNGPGSLAVARATPWTGEQWIFEGTNSKTPLPAPGSDVPPQTNVRALRMVFTALGDGAFRRDFERIENGTWVTSNLSTCKRLISPTAFGRVATGFAWRR